MLYLEELESLILAKLTPTMLEPGGGPLRAIHIRTFFDVAELDDLLQRFQEILPAGFLSEPTLIYATPETKPAGNVQKIDFTANYVFLAVNDSRRGPGERRRWGHDVVQRFNRAMTDRQFIGGVPEGFAFDHITLLTSASVVDRELYHARSFEFSVRVRGFCEEVVE
jgi:hypothetical protein